MSIPKRRLFASFWDSPPLHSPLGHINPKTFLNNSIPAPFMVLQGGLCGPSRPRFAASLPCVALPFPVSLLPFPVSPLPFPILSFPVFRTCNVRRKNAIPHTFSSGRVTSGNCQPAFQGPLWHFPVLPTCTVRKKIGLPRTFSSGRVTSGTA